MNRWASWAVPQVKFAARGGRQEKFLTLCMEKGVPLSRVKPAPGGFEAWVPARYYRALRGDARRCRTRLRVCQKRGLAFSLGWLKGRWGLAAGVVLFWLVLNLSGRLVWSIQYKGVGQQQAEQLSALLYSMDIGEGSVLTQEVLDDAQRELFRHTDELGWVALNFEKGRLTVEADPARPTPAVEENTPADLVAAAEGVILEMNVEEGLAAKKAGQTVAQGELLVSAARPDRDGNLYYSHPLASAKALVRRVYRCQQPLTFWAEVPTGRLAGNWGLKLAGMEWELPAPQSGFGRAEVKLTRRPLRVFGFALPGVVCRRLEAERETRQLVLTEEAARERAFYACRQALYREFPDAVLRTVEKRSERQGDSVAVWWEVWFEADIARRRPAEE